MLEGKTAAIKDRLAEMAQTPEDDLASRIGSYEQATGYEAYLDTDVPAIREKLEQIQEHEDTMTVLVVEPMREAYIKELPPGLSVMQQEVGGLIAAAYPFDALKKALFHILDHICNQFLRRRNFSLAGYPFPFFLDRGVLAAQSNQHGLFHFLSHFLNRNPLSHSYFLYCLFRIYLFHRHFPFHFIDIQ